MTLVAATLLAATPVHAAQRLERTLDRPGASAAASPGSAGWLGNPATALGARGLSLGVRLSAGGQARDNDRGAGWALHGGLPIGPLQVGFAVEHARDPAPDARPFPTLVPNRLTAGVAGRIDGWLDLGLAARWTRDVPLDIAPLMTLDLGMRATPWPWLSVGVHVSDLLGSSLYRYPARPPGGGDAGAAPLSGGVDSAGNPVLAGPLVRTAVALHGFSNRLFVALDLRWPNGEAIDGVRTTASWRFAPARRIGVTAAWSDLVQVGAVTAQDRRVSVFLQLGAHSPGRQASESWVGMERGVGMASAVEVDVAAGVDSAVGADSSSNGAVVGGGSWRAAGGVVVRHAPTAGVWSALARRFRRRGSATASPHLLDIAARQQRGWQGPLVGPEQAAAAAVARSFLRISSAFAAEDPVAVCASLAPVVRLDVRSADPAVLQQTSLAKAAACAQLRTPAAPWGQYLHELGPAAVHAEAGRYVGGLFAMHGSPYEWIPPKQEAAYREAMRRRPHASACHTWRVLPVRRAVDGERVVDVVVRCTQQRDFVMQLTGNTRDGYKLQKLLVER